MNTETKIRHTQTRKRTAKDDQIDRVLEVLNMAHHNCGLSPSDFRWACRAVNAHAALVHALKDCLADCKTHIPGATTTIANAKAALALADQEAR